LDIIKKAGFSFGKFGLIIGMLVVVIPLIWAAATFLLDKDAAEDITWVG